jgi:hypothetical protein
MFSFPALDVALGLIFVYFILALVCSAVNEWIATALRWRARDLERGIRNLLVDPKQTQGDVLATLKAFEAHPLVRSLFDPKRAPEAAAGAVTPETGRRRRSHYPSYIPSRTFAAALLGLSPKAVTAADPKNLRSIEETIQEIQVPAVRDALSALLHSAQGDAVAFRASVEQWYDDAMERVSGWYRRRVQRVLLVLAFVVAFTLNVDTLQIAKRLWSDPPTRAAIVNQADNAATNTEDDESAPKRLEKLPVPLGWHLASGRDDPQGFPIYHKPSMVWALVSKLIGLILTAVALTLGAPFWFDTLSKIARLRNSGAPPPASDAIRRGEGEETRRGATLVVQSAPGAGGGAGGAGVTTAEAGTGAPLESPAQPDQPPKA